MKIFAKIRFVYGALIIGLITSIFMIPLMRFSKKSHSDILHKYNALILKLLGTKIQTTGERDHKADMFVMNHQGIIDIIAMEAAENSDIRWIAKKELFDTPWFGYLLKLPDMIRVDREDKAGLIKLLRDAKTTVTEQSHRTMAIFPEGTRGKTQKLLPFKSGTKMVAEKLGLTIQPIIITNSKAVLNEHDQTANFPTTVHITYLDTFQADKSNATWYSELKEQMQAVIDQEKEIYNRER